MQVVEEALQQVTRKRDEARAGQSQAPAGPVQPVPDQGAQQLHQELDAAKQELERYRAHTCAPANVDVAQLQLQLQKVQAALKAHQAAIPVSDPQGQVVALEQECQTAQGRIREFLEEGQKLQNQFPELQNEKASQLTELEGRLKVRQMEMSVLQSQLKMESEFSGKRATEIDCLGEEIKRLTSEKDGFRSERDKLETELKQLKDASHSATVPQTTYPPPVGTGVPPGMPYGSLGLSQAHMLGHFTPLATVECALLGPAGGEGNHAVYPQPFPGILRQLTVRP